MEATKSPITTNEAGAMAALTERYGDKTDAKIALAKEYIADVERHWGGVKDWLNRTGLGNSPEFVSQIINAAERRRK